MSFRKTIFWLHLIAGVVAGVVIAIMSFTGVALAYEKQLIAWAERDARRVAPPSANAGKLPVDELLAKMREARPDAKPVAIVLAVDPREAVQFSFGRTNAIYANPYTGEIRPQAATATRGFMQTMIEWHRYVGASGEGRNTGKAITGACNAAFLVLAVSGLYLWWPRNWTKNAVRAVALMSFKLGGKARDFNWHNAIGLWTAPVLIVLTATAMPISYRWAGDLIYTLTGTEAPPPGAGPGAAGPALEITKPSPDARPLGMEALLARAQEAVPNWELITLRIGGGRAEAQPVSVTVKERKAWPLFSSVQLTLNPYTGEVLRRETYADQNAGRRVRSWTRFLHTGEALGLVGQGVAGLASFGALVLVWTGFALAWRRFFSRKAAIASPGTAGA